MSRTVDYRSVINRLTDAIKELNRPHAKDQDRDPKESAKRVAEERRRDAAKLLRSLLRALEQRSAAAPSVAGAANAAGTGAAAAANAGAAAAAERGAGAAREGGDSLDDAREQFQSAAFWDAVNEVANGEEPPDLSDFKAFAKDKGLDDTLTRQLYAVFYPSDRSVAILAELLSSLHTTCVALDSDRKSLIQVKNALSSALSTSDDNLAAAKSLLDNALVDVSDLVYDKVRLESRLDTTERNLTALRSQLVASQRDLTIAQRDLGISQSYETELSSRLVTSGRELAAARSDLTAAVTNLTTSQTELLQARERLQSSQTDLLTSRREHARVLGELATSQSNVRALQEQVALFGQIIAGALP